MISCIEWWYWGKLYLLNDDKLYVLNDDKLYILCDDIEGIELNSHLSILFSDDDKLYWMMTLKELNIVTWV
jgi:hypothetical protein